VSARHEPVLVRETLAFLHPGPGLFLDATLGDGGHAEALLLASDRLRLLGSDRDPAALTFARERLAPFGDRVSLAHGTFRDLPAAHAALGGERFAGALFDFGLSSRQIDDAGRGMSYRREGPLDLRMDPSAGPTLAERLDIAAEAELADVLHAHGDVPRARALAREILAAARAGQLANTRQLAALVGRVLRDARPAAIAPVFQALRIWVNDEMTGVRPPAACRRPRTSPRAARGRSSPARWWWHRSRSSSRINAHAVRGSEPFGGSRDETGVAAFRSVVARLLGAPDPAGLGARCVPAPGHAAARGVAAVRGRQPVVAGRHRERPAQARQQRAGVDTRTARPQCDAGRGGLAGVQCGCASG
jgi:16S rRNA (cytosine1402-N4)-methyltransferase